MRKNNKPAIRFKGFEANWKTWKIEDILTEKYQSVLIEDEKNYQLVTVKRRNEGVVSRGYLKGKNILVKNYFEVAEGDFIISKRQIIHGASGIVPRSLHKAVVSNEYLVATSNKNISSEYMTLISKLPDMHKIFFLSSYGVDIEKMVFDVRDWKKRNITIPNVNEQNNLTDFFQRLDQLITRHQQKHNKLQALKKAMLGKMFPKQGQAVPEIRFKGFEGDWIKTSISFFSERFDNLRIPIKAENRISGSTPYYGANGIQDYVEGFTHEGEFILIAEDGANDLINYPIQYANGKIWVNNHAHALQAKKGVAITLFLKYAISQTNIISFLVGGGRAKLNAETMMKIEVNITEDLNEQKKIADYFFNVEKLIANSETQITKLQNIKKALLAKMFV